MTGEPPASTPPRHDAVDGTRALAVAGAATGLAGVLCAATTTIWPTLVLSLRMPEVGDFTRGSQRSFWAWGRDVVSYTSNGLVLDDAVGPRPVPRLVLLVLVLCVAGASLVAVIVRPRGGTHLLGALCTALALGVVVSSAVWRWSFDDRTGLLQPGVRVVTTAAGWSETVAVALLAVAVVLLVGPCLVPRASASLAARLAESWRRLREVEEEDVRDGFTDDLDAGRG